MIDPAVKLYLDGNRRVYRPGDTLSGEYRLDSFKPAEARAVEVSVAWHTEGQGDEDLAVHFFERRCRDEEPELDLRRPRRFSTHLPPSPLSYDGLIVKIRWCVRVRMFLERGRELFAELPFRLGSVPPPPVNEERPA